MNRIIFTGTGTSEGVPRLSCLTKQPPTCKVCIDAKNVVGSKNRRRNTGAVLQIYSEKEDRIVNIMIDCGKFWWHSALEIFPKYGIQKLDAIVLTHDHYDAMGGLDDLRDLSRDPDDWRKWRSIPIYLRRKDYFSAQRSFPYLTDIQKATGGGDVPRLSFRTFKNNNYNDNDNDNCDSTVGESGGVVGGKKKNDDQGKKKNDDEENKFPYPELDVEVDAKGGFEVAGIRIQPINVEHGSCSFCGFRVGDLCYISDVSSIPFEAGGLIEGSRLLVLDCLFDKKDVIHPSHLNLNQAVEIVGKYLPEKAFFVGMGHSMDHDFHNTKLETIRKEKEMKPTMELAYDGLCLNIDEFV